MLLKKQTVWLLTMLSLVVVLSVYYITSPEQKSNDLAAVQQKAKDQNLGKTTTGTKENSGKTVVSSVASDGAFDELRMKLEDLRSQKQEELTSQLASTDLTPDEKSKVKDQMDKLNQVAQSEELLETFIKTMGYEDVLVRADGSKVIVTVKAKKKPSVSDANKIMLEVKKEIDETNYVAVEYQPAK
ncbi:stage III sporulation protein AH [Neobacillus bataviensis]|jgi:stage III sporulation protein AH|uniref:Stage III sporulation protein AH n=1 Tax=Neobacillus bataviensis TaxID=220685 RepID=A0A561DSG4_9BACI|nr:SpoIIIAH-like family protein [Neobacillus bataviensis]TWE06325.1 stage III sporulation protein AH [Neobacillus bataviensis]